MRRVGLGKLKHIDAKYLWMQHARKQGRLGVFKVDGTKNGVNLMTKHMDKQTLETDMANCGLVVLTGRNSQALRLEIDTASMSKSSVLLVLAICQMAGARGEDGTDDEESNLVSFWVPLMLGLLVLLVCLCCGCWCGWRLGRTGKHTSTRALGTMTERLLPEPVAEALSARVQPALPLKVVVATRSVATRARQCYHVASDCRGLRNACQVKDLWACQLCCEPRPLD